MVVNGEKQEFQSSLREFTRLSMNFNNNGPKPKIAEPKKNHNKTIIGAVITASLVVVATLGAIYMAGEMNNTVEQFSSIGSSYHPSAEEIRERCISTLRDIMDAEPPKLSVNICVGTVLGELNK